MIENLEKDIFLVFFFLISRVKMMFLVVFACIEAQKFVLKHKN